MNSTRYNNILLRPSVVNKECIKPKNIDFLPFPYTYSGIKFVLKSQLPSYVSHNACMLNKNIYILCVPSTHYILTKSKYSLPIKKKKPFLK